MSGEVVQNIQRAKAAAIEGLATVGVSTVDQAQGRPASLRNWSSIAAASSCRAMSKALRRADAV